MLTNVFRRLYLAESEAPAPAPAPAAAPSGGVIEGGLKQDCAFLNLPVDILVIFLNYLRSQDLIALSLTTKALRWVRPALELSDDPLVGIDHLHSIQGRAKARLIEQRKAEALCSRRTHQRFLPPSVPSNHRCPYCAHPLCPPSCRTALFLDTLTGIFYPAHLYRTNKAIFKYSANAIQSLFSSPLMPTEPNGRGKSQRIVYSTIWCEHHRCPRNLISKPSNTGSSLTNGAQKFLAEYTQSGQGVQWSVVGRSKQLGYWIHDRWRAGYRPDPSNPDSQIPVHEAFSYSMICLHCLQAATYQMIGSLPAPTEYFCRCEAVSRRGCRRCGVVSVKITRVEVFDLPTNEQVLNSRLSHKEPFPREGFWLYVAVDYKLGPSLNPHASEPQRLYPMNPQKAAQLLFIVRGFNLAPLSPPPSPKPRLQDLPYPILRRIVLHLQPLDVKRYIRFEDTEFFCLCSSYCFIKATFGIAAPMRSLEYLKEPWYLMCTGRKGALNSTKLFMRGQVNAKVREEQWKMARIAWSTGTGLRDLLAQP